MTDSDMILKEGDTAPTLRWLLENASGPQNLTGATVKMIFDDGRWFDMNVDAPGTAGIVSLDVSDPDIAGDRGTHEFEFHVTYADTTEQTFPNTLTRPRFVVHPAFTAAP